VSVPVVGSGIVAPAAILTPAWSSQAQSTATSASGSIRSQSQPKWPSTCTPANPVSAPVCHWNVESNTAPFWRRVNTTPPFSKFADAPIAEPEPKASTTIPFAPTCAPGRNGRNWPVESKHNVSQGSARPMLRRRKIAQKAGTTVTARNILTAIVIIRSCSGASIGARNSATSKLFLRAVAFARGGRCSFQTGPDDAALMSHLAVLPTLASV
jgi:hypothetical protein